MICFKSSSKRNNRSLYKLFTNLPFLFFFVKYTLLIKKNLNNASNWWYRSKFGENYRLVLIDKQFSTAWRPTRMYLGILMMKLLIASYGILVPSNQWDNHFPHINRAIWQALFASRYLNVLGGSLMFFHCHHLNSSTSEALLKNSDLIFFKKKIHLVLAITPL